LLDFLSAKMLANVNVRECHKAIYNPITSVVLTVKLEIL
jgi:hypothetical protein